MTDDDIYPVTAAAVVARAGVLFILSGVLFGCGFAAMMITDSEILDTA